MSALDPADPILNALRLGANQFPGAWNYTMPTELRGLKLPDERRATCMNCPKACYEDYRPDYRCCTYHPRIPNYLMGLNALGPNGDLALDLVLERGMLLPEGMNHAPMQWYDYLDDLQNESFGKSTKVLCPMLDQSNGYCRAHAFRNSVCSTFFCLKDHGQAGDEFWASLQTLGTQVELSLSQWCLRTLGFDLQLYFKTFTKLSTEMHNVSSQTGWKDYVLDSLWGSWRGHEKEIMLECGRLVSKHRDDLWDIANTFAISESAPFNIAMIKGVPKHLEDQIDPEDLEEDEDAEAAKPRDLWKSVMKNYDKLWDLPEGRYILSPRVEIIPNKGIDQESLYHVDQPFSLRVYTRKGSRTLDWRMYIQQADFDVLQLFKQDGVSLDWSLLMNPVLSAHGRGKEFIAEMLKSKVLVREAVH
ncbi:MAG: hypothetical protein EOP10_08525 [Proteobacteria bacterium]|nr:MAG: hypothetical protein EOP10_08525 [Pseudomonadota bacterium]